MKKSYLILSLMFGLLVSAAFTACGSDDDDNAGGGGKGGSTKRIVKMVETEGDWKAESSFSYDAQGRVTRIVCNETGTHPRVSETNYQYSEEHIISKEVAESQGYTSNTTYTYTLASGLIVKENKEQNGSKKTTTYSYDDNGYLASLSTWGSSTQSSTKSFVWENGNLTQLDSRKWTYSSTPWPQGMMFYYKGSNIDYILQATGFFGKMSKMMPSSYDSGDKSAWSFEYAVSNGYITTMTIVNKDGDKDVTSFVWE